MPDAPDYFSYRLESTKHLLADMAELAARLGSLVSFDRRGTLVWMDGFENSLSPWESQAAGTGAAVAVVTSPTYQGGYSCKLTGGSTDPWVALVQKNAQVITLNRLGVEFTFSQETSYDYIESYAFYSSGTQYITWRIRLNPATNTLQYKDAAGAWQTFAAWKFADENKCRFHTLKYVVDLDTHEFVRCFLDRNVYVFSGEKPQVSAVVDNPSLLIRFSVYSRAGFNDVVYVDNAIVTADEP